MKSVVLVLTVLAGTAGCQQIAPRRDVQQILSTKVPHYVVKGTNLLQAAAQIASDFDLPMGVEWQGDPTAEKEINSQWDNATVERIVLDLATFDVEYQVDVSNGVVHLQKRGLAASSRNPLNIKVPSFSVTSEYSRQAAFRLRNQVNLMIFPRQPDKVSACAGSRSAGADETKVTLSIKDATVRDILDSLLVRSHSAMWLVAFRKEQPDTGFLATKSPWRSTTESEQPDLDVLARYDDPVTGRYRGDWEKKIGQ
jgi:hypothetical protein